jgi:Cu(I)/Ag(I) efflux system membrane fusion protein
MNTFTQARWWALAALCLVVGAALGFALSQFTASRYSNAAGPSEAGQSQRQVLYWHDPMAPGQKFDKPGKSPFMDMDLAPVYADEAGGANGIKVTSNVTQSLGIRLGKAERLLVQPTLSAVGSVVFDENRVQLIQARVEGYVQKLRLKAALDRVRKGQVVAEVTAPQWQQALQEYAALLQSESLRAHELALATRERLQVLDVPAAAIDAVARTHRVAPTIAILAPIDGVVTELGVREGAGFAAGATLFRIIGLETVWVNAQIPEAQVAAVPAGASVTARATAWPGETFVGRVQAVLPDVDANTRTLTVRIGIDNALGKLSPGMFVSLDIRQPRGELQLSVPSEAVIVTGQRTVVLRATASGGFNPVDVVTGGQIGARTIILKGLQEGQSIVLSGQFLIDSEASLKSTEERLSSGEAQPSAQQMTGPQAPPPPPQTPPR